MVECFPPPDWMGFLIWTGLAVALLASLVVHIRQKATIEEKDLKIFTLESMVRSRDVTLDFRDKTIKQLTEMKNLLLASVEEFDRMTDALKGLGLEIEWSTAEAMDKPRRPLRLLNTRSTFHFQAGPRVWSTPAGGVNLRAVPLKEAMAADRHTFDPNMIWGK